MKEFTIRQAAEIRKVHPDTVRAKIKAGKISARLITLPGPTSIYLISEKELEKITAEPGGRPRKHTHPIRQ